MFNLGQVMDVGDLKDIICSADFKVDISKVRTAEKRKEKGGKERLSRIIGNIGNVVDLMHKAGKNKVFPIISGGADIHSYRRDYANTFYRILARPLDTLIEDDLYVCQKDKAGVVYDRWAMLCVSENLGHNRIDVIAAHYLD